MQKSWGATKHTEGFGSTAQAVRKKNNQRNNAPASAAIGHRQAGKKIGIEILFTQLSFCWIYIEDFFHAKEDNYLLTRTAITSCVSCNARAGVVIHHTGAYLTVCTRCWFAIIDILKNMQIRSIRVDLCVKKIIGMISFWNSRVLYSKT